MKIPTPTPRQRDLLIAAAIVSLAALLIGTLSGCGGADTPPPVDVELGRDQRTPASTARDPDASAGHALEPLFDDRGHVLIGPRAQPAPADTMARSRLDRYATHQQLERELLAHRDDTVVLDLDDTGAESAVIYATTVGHWHGDPDRVNFFVRSRDARAAAGVANTLADLGFTRVFVVV